jgi:enoyl-CoA hydratase/carnithine racemase
MDETFAPDLLIETEGAVRVLTLNRPESLNAVSASLHEALEHVWRHIAADPEARAVVITGAGRAFSAGGDMDMIVSMQHDLAFRRAGLGQAQRIVSEVMNFPLPVIAAVNGPAVGLGCTVAACTDIVLIADTAFMADPHVSVGLTAGDGGTAVWPLLMGMLRAKEYLLSGDRISAEQAVAFGLANRVVPAAALMPEALALAARLAAQPPQAVQSTKRALNLHLQRAISGVIEYALAEGSMSFDTPEHRAAIARMLARESG